MAHKISEDSGEYVLWSTTTGEFNEVVVGFSSKPNKTRRFTENYLSMTPGLPITKGAKEQTRSELISSLSNYFSNVSPPQPSFFKSISLEPLMFIYALTWAMQIHVVRDMAQQKVCEQNLKYSWDDCQNITSLPEAQKIHKESDRLLSLSYFITNIPSIVLVLFLGPWSDRYGCKATLIFPFIGSLLATVVYMINALQWDMSAEILILAGFPRALGGGPVTLQMSAYSYISDSSPVESRTFLLGSIVLLYTFGRLLGELFSGIILVSIGHGGVFLLNGIIFVLCIAYITSRIKENRGPFSISGFSSSCIISQSVLDIPTLENLKASLDAVQRHRDGNSRARIWLYIIAICIISFCTGVAPLEWKFIKNQFDWPFVEYERFHVYDNGIGIVGSFAFLFFIGYLQQVGDVLLAMIGSLSMILGILLKGLAVSGWMLYLGATITLVPQVALIAVYSAVSKLVSHSEYGAIFGEMCALETLMPLISYELYSHLYIKTAQLLPSAIYVFTAVLTSFTALTFLFIKRLERIRPGYQQL